MLSITFVRNFMIVACSYFEIQKMKFIRLSLGSFLFLRYLFTIFSFRFFKGSIQYTKRGLSSQHSDQNSPSVQNHCYWYDRHSNLLWNNVSQKCKWCILGKDWFVAVYVDKFLIYTPALQSFKPERYDFYFVWRQ